MSITGATSHADSTTIRVATPDDAEAIYALLGQSGFGQPPRGEFDAAFAAAVTSAEDHLLLVADTAGSVSAYTLVFISRPLYVMGRSAQVQELVVAESVRHSGVGSRLIGVVEQECMSRGVVQLTVASRRAAAFYERLDYRSTSDYLKKIFIEE